MSQIFLRVENLKKNLWSKPRLGIEAFVEALPAPKALETGKRLPKARPPKPWG
jgi:hypothetical protein